MQEEEEEDDWGRGDDDAWNNRPFDQPIPTRHSYDPYGAGTSHQQHDT
jgi:hypothetical protein